MKTRIAIFFSIVFVSLLAAPSIISLTATSLDIVFFLDINEEEEASKVDSELKIYPTTFAASFLSRNFQITKNIRFHSKNYVSKTPKISIPPPKFIL